MLNKLLTEITILPNFIFFIKKKKKGLRFNSKVKKKLP